MRTTAFLLIVLSVLVAPLVFLRQWGSDLGLFSGPSLEIQPAPGMMLVIREALPALFLLSVAASHPSFWSNRRMRSIVWLSLLLLFGFAVNLAVQPHAGASPKVGLVVGIRFLIFFLLPLAVLAFLSGSDPRRSKTHYIVLLSAVIGVLLLNILVSVLEVWFGYGFIREGTAGWGITSFGARAIGITINPNAAATLFGLGGLLMLLDSQPGWLSLGFWGASIFGSLLTGSRTGIIGTVTVGVAALLLTRPRYRLLVLLGSVPIFMYLLSNLGELSGRAEFLSLLRESGPFDPRISTLTENIQKLSGLELIVGRGLGYASNTAFRILSQAEAAHAGLVSVDSLLTLTILEFGFLGAAVFWALTSRFFLTFTSWRLGVTFLLYFVVFSLTQNFLESYPASTLLGILLGCSAAQQSRRESLAKP